MDLYIIQDRAIAASSADDWYVMPELQRAINRENPSLVLTWGHDKSTEDPPEWHPEQHKFASSWVHILWHGELIDRVEMTQIDGTPVPMPDGLMQVTEFELAAAELLRSLAGSRFGADAGHHLEQVGVAVVRDQDRDGAGSRGDGSLPIL